MSERNGTAAGKKREMVAEIKAMHRIELAIRDLPACCLNRVGKWAADYASDLATAKFLEGKDEDLPSVPKHDNRLPGDDEIEF